jgi:dTDP-glucose 4,6-dehydratase
MIVLVTGGCGFIGHHFVEHVYKNTDWTIIIIDKLTKASKGLERIRDLGYLDDPRVRFYCYDLTVSISEGLKMELGNNIDVIIHMAAESHVTTSIRDPVNTITNNVLSTVHILEFARGLKNLQKFFYFSTDEVYGPAPDGTMFKESDGHNPTNPYSASKAAAEDICLAYQTTYKLPLIVINVMNAMGERQHVEKFIPNTIRKILNGEKVDIHCNENLDTGHRFYIHCRNIADGVIFLMDKGIIGEKYNITGEREISNLKMAQIIAKTLNKELIYELVVPQDRPGHDFRYGLCGNKMFDMGWKMPLPFDESLKKLILWSALPEHKKWLED